MRLRFISSARGSLLVATLLVGVGMSASLRAEPLDFDATFALRGFGGIAPLARPGPSWSGSGIGVSSTAPNAISFLQLAHSTGMQTTTFMGIQGTGGFPTSDILLATLDAIEDPSFGGTPLAGPMLARGKFTALLDFDKGSIGLGVGGTIPFTTFAPTGGTPITGSIVFAPWTTVAVPLTGISKRLLVSSFIHPVPVNTITLSGYDARTPGGLGAVQLVTPVQIFTDLGEIVFKTGGYGVLTLDFVPEPSRVVALGAGVVALLVLGARGRSHG